MNDNRVLTSKEVASPRRADANIKVRPSKTNAHLRAGDLQRTEGHVEYLSDLFSACSPLDESSGERDRLASARPDDPWCQVRALRLCSARPSFTRHLNGGFNGSFETYRVVGRGFISIAEVHAIRARAHLAQSEPELTRDRFGFLERSGFWNCHRKAALSKSAS